MQGLPGLPVLPGGGMPGMPGMGGLQGGGMPGMGNFVRPPFGNTTSTGGLLPNLPGLPAGIRAVGGKGGMMMGRGVGFPGAGSLQVPGMVRGPCTTSLAASTSKAAAPVVVPKPPGVIVPPGGLAPSLPAAPCTVYVGRISAEVSDDFVRHLLEKCGKISKWNRAADPNTAKLTSFGFCDFEEAQGVWRALEFLHEQQLCDKRLLVKCEEKAKQTIEKWKAARREELEKKPDQAELTDELLNTELRKESEGASEDIARILKEKNKGYPEVRAEGEAESKEEAGDKNGKANGEKGEDKENVENKDGKTEDAANDRGNHDRQRSRSRDRKLSRSEERRRQKEGDKKAPQALSRHYRVSRREREREHRVRERDRDIDKEYQYRIREFERGEDKRLSNLKRDLRDLEMPPEPSERDKRKFIERDLNFGRSESEEREWKHYREDRLEKRQRESEKDAADRVAQQKEVEEERRKEEEEERKKRKEEEEAKRKAREEAEAERRRQREEEKARREEELRKEQEELERKREEERQRREAELVKQQEAAAAKLLQSVSACVQEERRSTSADKAMGALFRAGEEPLGADGQPRKHKPLTRLEGPSGTGPAGGEVKLRDDEMRRLIQQVPTDKAKAFAFDIDWQSVADHNIVEKKLRPWVKKKVTEYLGTEEQGMIEFIMRKVSSRTSPESILAELEGFLDEEAENFTLKMWRMLIFEVLRVKAR